ncbi:sensor histidine kinase [Endothiovibrio diazotrophicus]
MHNPIATSSSLDSAQRLEDAFNVFNEMSLSLEASYRDLENQVARLHEALAVANSERLRELAEKEQLANRLERLLEALPAGVLVLDGDGVVRECNPAAVDLLGKPLLGERWREVTLRAFERSGGNGDEIVLQDGRRVSVSVRSLGSEPGQIVLLKDVTETRALQEMVARQQRLTAMGEVAAGLAHQIRTPLASALLYISNLGRPNLDAAGRARFAERIRDRLRHMERMVNDMLVFARGGSTDSEAVALDGLLADLAQTLEPQLAAVGGGIEVDQRVAGVTLHGNREALLGALINLGANAIQAVGEGVRLRVDVRLEGAGFVAVRVADNGPGIGEDIRETVFEPFFTTRPDGTGLGLAVVRNVVEAHHGRIELEQPQAGEGACFAIRLPTGERRQALLSGEAPAPGNNQEDETMTVGLAPSVEGGWS